MSRKTAPNKDFGQIKGVTSLNTDRSSSKPKVKVASVGTDYFTLHQMLLGVREMGQCHDSGLSFAETCSYTVHPSDSSSCLARGETLPAIQNSRWAMRGRLGTCIVSA